MTLNETVEKIRPLDQLSMLIAKNALDNIAKPLNSLGKLEKLIIKSTGIFRTHKVDFDKKCVFGMCRI